MEERAAQLLLNSFPRYADSARRVQLRSVESGQTFSSVGKHRPPSLDFSCQLCRTCLWKTQRAIGRAVIDRHYSTGRIEIFSPAVLVSPLQIS
jgi:hypothetical protein